MRDAINVISWVGLFGIALGLAVANIYWHLIYPDMTETRLFLTHWKQYTGAFVAFLILGIIYDKTK